MKLNKLTIIVLLMLTACLPPPPPNSPPVDSQTASPSDTQPDSVQPTSDSASADSHSDSPHTDVLDITHLTLGDNKTSSSPQIGYVYACNTQFNGGGASGTGPWINGDGTWDLTKKYVVDGSVSWPHSFTISVQGNDRVFASNNLPDHTTGNYPISSDDDAYQIDRNPNSIAAQNSSFSVPANPTVTAQPTCVGGEVGIMLSGVLIFSSFDAEGRDAVAHEVQDHCDGHPQQNDYYHYHSLSNCIEDNTTGHSALVGYAFDGFGIYGFYGEDGEELTNSDLDECHGHTHVIEWDGQLVEMYHYHATREFPYVVGCFRGTPSVKALTAENLGGGNGQSNGNQVEGQNGGAGSPPQEAIDACVNLSQGATCSINTPNGQLNGTCNLPPNAQQLACIPVGGQP
ncbi:MAG TPA: YHYH protein [Anaerolineales bacterium]|nr:YHYH protein [Anaerolineales bacterium]